MRSNLPTPAVLEKAARSQSEGRGGLTRGTQLDVGKKFGHRTQRGDYQPRLKVWGVDASCLTEGGKPRLSFRSCFHPYNFRLGEGGGHGGTFHLRFWEHCFLTHLLAGDPFWAVPWLGSPGFHPSLPELSREKMSKRGCPHALVSLRNLVPDQLLTFLR